MNIPLNTKRSSLHYAVFSYNFPVSDKFFVLFSVNSHVAIVTVATAVTILARSLSRVHDYGREPDKGPARQTRTRGKVCMVLVLHTHVGFLFFTSCGCLFSLQNMASSPTEVHPDLNTYCSYEYLAV
jgi:hypothetical protein